MTHSLFTIEGDPTTATWLIEVPHGADAPRFYRFVEGLLTSPLPDDLIAFFQVNTDVGSWALATALKDALEARGHGVCAIRCGIPRTFVDVNRVLSGGEQGFTPGLQPWITTPEDRALLTHLHTAYSDVVGALYRQICGNGGRALIPHTYAPRTVPITTVDRTIVEQLRGFYETERIEACPLRPELDFITHTPEGVDLALPGVPALIERLREAGVAAESGGSYTLHPVTMGAHWSALYPQQVLCFEVRRDLVTEWTPFDPQPLRHDRITAIAEALVGGLLA
jgi:hypothetical protein